MWKQLSRKILPFTFFYFTLSVVLYIIALPFLVYLTFKQKYRESIPSRFFLFKNSRFTSENGIWFHVCSLGEAKALKPILDLLENKNIKITTITHTGQAEAKKYDAQVRYLPYEMFLPFWINKQKFLIVLEAEFWFMLFTVASFKKTRIILLNSRISDKSVKKYLKFAWFYKKFFKKVETIYAQSDVDKSRFLALGARNIEVIGNLKLATKITQTKKYDKPDIEVIVGGSTHDTEEESILKSFIEYRKQNNSKLIIVPRHPERFESVYNLMQKYSQKSNLSLSKFSQAQDFKADMILVDAMGELNNIYAISDIAILGGAFVDGIGGHNPLEPAYFNCKIISGKFFHDQKELFKYVQHIQCVQSNEIYKALVKAKELLSSSVKEEIDITPVIAKLNDIN
jgi:3-deoxy-D-manno-octulosonic-acid transferase